MYSFFFSPKSTNILNSRILIHLKTPLPCPYQILNSIKLPPRKIRILSKLTSNKIQEMRPTVLWFLVCHTDVLSVEI